MNGYTAALFKDIFKYVIRKRCNLKYDSNKKRKNRPSGSRTRAPTVSYKPEGIL